MKKEILIIGGGFAGLSAAVEAASRGHQVTLLEKRQRLGGRAYSYKEPVTGDIIDNGQHLLMGCYRETLNFLDTLGVRSQLSFQRNLRVPFVGEGASARLWCPPLPAPWHAVAGLMSFKGLSWHDRLRLRRLKDSLPLTLALSPMGRGDPLDDTTVTQWLTSLGQTSQARERFWNVLTLAALNDHPDRSSADLFRAVLREALFTGRKASAIVVPKLGLSELYIDAARDYIERSGGHVLTKSPVLKLHFRANQFEEVELEGGRRLAAESLILAVPFTALRRLIPERLLYGESFFSPIFRLKTVPIVAVHFWFDRLITKEPFVGLWGTQTQWLFSKGKRNGGYYVTLIISGAHEFLARPAVDIQQTALDEIRRLFPASRDAKVLYKMVTKEPEATMMPAVGVNRCRLPQKTPQPNLFLAGDWTDTGLPATIESAVRSARKCVELVEGVG